MVASALASAETLATATNAEDSAWSEPDNVERAFGQDAWVFDDIFLEPQAPHVTPNRVVVRIEAELLGYIVEELTNSRPRRSWRKRKSYTPTRAEAVIEAGRITHSWLSRGYSVCRP